MFLRWTAGRLRGTRTISIGVGRSALFQSGQISRRRLRSWSCCCSAGRNVRSPEPVPPFVLRGCPPHRLPLAAPQHGRRVPPHAVPPTHHTHKHQPATSPPPYRPARRRRTSSRKHPWYSLVNRDGSASCVAFPPHPSRQRPAAVPAPRTVAPCTRRSSLLRRRATPCKLPSGCAHAVLPTAERGRDASRPSAEARWTLGSARAAHGPYALGRDASRLASRRPRRLIRRTSSSHTRRPPTRQPARSAPKWSPADATAQSSAVASS